MVETEFWPGLADAWQATESPSGASGNASPKTAHGGRWRSIKSESRSRVLLLEAEGCSPLVLKIYRTPPRLRWRTFALASRANREFTVMMNAHRLGLPVIRPRYWLEQRSLGCVEFSAIALDFVDGPDLESWLIGGDGGPEQRRSIAEATGRLLASFHREGLFWSTVSTRNILLPAGRTEALLAFDMPYARIHSGDLRGQPQAMMDLALVLQLSDGRPAFDERERDTMIRAYCDGDADQARILESQLCLPSHREWKRKRLLRRLNNLFSKGANSTGRGGLYVGGANAYQQRAGESVVLFRGGSLHDGGPCATP